MCEFLSGWSALSPLVMGGPALEASLGLPQFGPGLEAAWMTGLPIMGDGLSSLARDAWLLAQEAAPPAPGQGAGGRGIFGETSFIWVMLAIGVLFYFLMMRPEQKQKARMQDMQQNLKKNDRVLTLGGIYGTVVNASKGSSDVTIRIDENSNAKMRVERSAIRRVISEDEKDTAKDKTTDEDRPSSD